MICRFLKCEKIFSKLSQAKLNPVNNSGTQNGNFLPLAKGLSEDSDFPKILILYKYKRKE